MPVILNNSKYETNIVENSIYFVILYTCRYIWNNKN